MNQKGRSWLIWALIGLIVLLGLGLLVQRRRSNQRYERALAAHDALAEMAHARRRSGRRFPILDYADSLETGDEQET
jgi:LPXTG-motif cell wall-anchored protein